MHKLKLDLDALLVESFATLDAELETRGTVHGREATGLCTRASCVEGCGPSQDASCACTLVTCAYTCNPLRC